MKTITIQLNSITKLVEFLLSTDCSTDDLKLLKYNHHFLFVNTLLKVLTDKKPVTISIDSLPVLSDDFKALKSFMSSVRFKSIIDYNQRREEAKSFFTFQTISELDGSGYIKQLNLIS